MATIPTLTPEPPASIPQYILDGLDRQDAQTLQEISRYVEDPAAAKEAEAELKTATRRSFARTARTSTTSRTTSPRRPAS